jgi:Leucine-rich repeat (LRR) protein
MGGNHLSSLPDEMVQFSKLRVLFFSGNDFERVPVCLGALSSLYMLSFKHNKLVEVAEERYGPQRLWCDMCNIILCLLAPSRPIVSAPPLAG